MTITQALEIVDRLTPNQYDMEDKIRWLAELDGIAHREVLRTHEMDVPEEFHPYRPEQDLDRTVLLIGAPRTPLEFSNIVSKLIMREEDSGMIRKFKAKRLFFQSLEPVDWVLDGEFGGTRTEAEIVNLNRRIEILKNTAK